MRYFRRRWDEDRGDHHADWGASWWYFATTDDGILRQQVEDYDNGPVLHYDERHMVDAFGGLSDQPLDLDDFHPFEIDRHRYAAAIRRLLGGNVG